MLMKFDRVHGNGKSISVFAASVNRFCLIIILL